MAQYVQPITLDVAGRDVYKYVYAKQGDSGSRSVCATILANGEKVTPETGATAKFRAVKPDGTSVLSDATVNSDGTITVEFPDQTLTVAGVVTADIVLFGADGEALSTVSFKIEVEEAPVGSKATSDNDFLSLVSMVSKGNQIIDQFLVEIARLNNLVINAGDTGNNAELIDIRVGHDGTIYDTAGKAVRSLGEELAAVKDQIMDYIDKKAVDGLLVEGNLLYLTSDGEIVSDPVELPAGGGGGGSTGPTVIVKLKNETGTTAITTPEGSDVELKFNFTSTEDDVATGNGTCEIRVNGAVKATKSISQGSNAVNVKDYLSEGTNTVKVTCTDAYGNYRSLTYTVTVVALSVTSTFDDSLIYSGDITFKFTPYGSVEKTIHYVLDGTESGTDTITASGKQSTKIFPAMSHGSHTLKVYATATMGGVAVTSNVLSYDIICVQSGQTGVIIASAFDKTEATQGDLLTIPFQVYDPSNQAASVTLTIKSGSTAYATQTRTVGRTKETWSTRQYPTGTVQFIIACGSVTKTHTLTVAENVINVQPVTNDLEVHLSSAGRSNSESNRNTWTSGDDVSTTFTNVNWDTTGWVQDSEGDTALRLFGTAKADIGFQPFATDFRTYGKTIEIEFAVRDVNNRDAVVLSCMNGGIGIKITADKAVLYSEQSSIECRFTDGEKLRVAFTVESRSEYRLMSIYLNGILSGACQYPDNDNFQQPSPVDITVGSPYCGIDLYTIRAYSTALSYSEVRDNYIADTTDTARKLELYNANNIYDDYGNLSYEAVKSRIPVMTIVGALPTAKGDKKQVRIKYEDPFNPTLNFDTNDDDGACTIDVQGTSSQWYVRKNWKLKFKNAHTHVTGMLPAKVFCMKADYAEATGTHNTQNANLVGTLYTAKTPPQETDERIRTTVYGFPCVIYHQATEADTPVFNGKYNFNYDKGAENVYGFSDTYPSAESWEFCNNTSDACLFHGALPSDWSNDFEARYPDGCEDISHFKTMHDWVVSTYQDGATGSALSASYTDADGAVHTKDNAAYRLAKFKKEFTEHFDKDFCLLYYVYTFVMLMVDQRAKNMFLTTWDGTHWEPWLYDNDTCLGINNEGALVFDYYHEDIDQLDGANVYNGQTSALWVNFKAAFASEIKALYQSLRNSGKLTPDVIYQYFVTNGARKWSESIYNEDAVFKYISMLQSDGDASNLPQIRGSGESHLRYFVDNRIMYCDSKWYAPDYANDYVSLRIYTPVDANGAVKTGLAVAANANITVKPFSDMYAGVRYKANGTLQQTRATKNTEVTFTAPGETFNDTETAIYGASQLSSVGDLAPLYCGSVNVSKATKLTNLKIGDATSGYSNTNLTSLSVGTNKLLKTIDVRNCPNLTAPLALSNCPNIEEIYADGSGITGVELPQSGYLKVLKLPATITNLTLLNQTHIETFSCAGYTNLTTLRVENCVNVPVPTIVNAATNLSRVRLLNVSLSCDNAAPLKVLMSCGGLDESGNNTATAVVTGSAHITTLKPSELSAIQAKFPNLTVTYDTLETEYTITFKDWDGAVLDVQTVEKYGNAVDPVTSGKIATPTKASTAQHDYTYSGWSGSLSSIAADRTVTAQYTQTVRSYTIRFMNGSDVLQSSLVLYGEIPSYTGTNPTPTSSSQIFSGWTPEISAVTGAQDYVATFTTLTVPSAVKTLENCTWLEIKAVAAAGYKNANNQWCYKRGDTEEVWWNIGDEKTITLSDGEEITLQIYDFEHDDKSDGTKAPLTFGMKHLMAATQKMNSSSTNVGGWESSIMRTTTLPAIFDKLPSVLQAIICEVSKKASAGNKSTDVLISADKLFLFSEVEVDGTTNAVYKDEGTKYPIFTSNTSRIKNLANGTGSADSWWLRSPYTGYTTYFQYVGSNGGVYTNGASYSIGVAFGFCI